MATQHATVELYYSGGWQTVPVYTRDPISITRGKRDEQSGIGPSTASLTLDDREELYNPRNPMSPLHGEAGRNTPVRIGLALASDDFDRTESGGWGSTPDGTSWIAGTPADTSVSGGEGVLAQGINALRSVSLDVDLVDVEQLVDVESSQLTTGAPFVVGVTARRSATTGDCYWLYAELATSGAVTVKITSWISSSLTILAATVTSLTYAADTPLRIRASVSGQQLGMSIWDPATEDEPLDWTVTATDDALTAAGRAGVMTWRVSGNTNVGLVARYDNYRAVDRRFTGEVASWKPQRTLEFVAGSGRGDAWVEIEAAGILRRLSQNPDELPSAVRRATVDDSPTAYWPLEDGDGSTSAVSVVDGVGPMQTFGYSRFTAPGTGTPEPAAGLPRFGTGGGIPGSLPVVDLSQGGVLQGTVPAGTSAGWRIEFTMVAPRDKASTVIPIRWVTSGTWDTWEFQIEASGIFATFGTGLTAAGSASANFNVFDGLPHHYAIWAVPSGSETAAVIYVDGIQVAAYAAFVPPMTGGPGSIISVIINPLEEVNGTTALPILGHVAVWNTGSPGGVDDHTDAARGHLGETTAERFERLCAEQGITAVVVGDPDDTQAMGAQRVDTFVALLGELERTEDGLVYEARDSLGLVLRTRASRYNPTARLTVDWDAGQVAPPFAPVIDDQGTRNDITVKSTTTGATARSVEESGRMSVQAPPAGVGRYAVPVDVNPADDDDLAHHASWHRHKGTTDEARFPQVSVDLVAAPELAAAAAGTHPGDLAEVPNLPAAVNPGTASLVVLGDVETIGAATRRITFVGVPASPWLAIGVYDTSRYDTSGAELAANFVAGTDGSMSVATTAGPLWTTAAADMPMVLLARGVRITVSAVAGASSPQTMTVSGVSLSGLTIPAGTPVSVANPGVYAR